MYKVKDELREILQYGVYQDQLFELENNILLGKAPDFTRKYKFVLPISHPTHEWNEIFLHPTDPQYHYFLNSLNDWDWANLSAHPLAIPLLENNMKKICWHYLSLNPGALHLLRRYPEKIEWNYLCWNSNPESLQLLIENIRPESTNDRAYISFSFLEDNEIIYDVDYKAIEQRIQPYIEDLFKAILHPKRVARIYDMIGEDDDICSYM